MAVQKLGSPFFEPLDDDVPTDEDRQPMQSDIKSDEDTANEAPLNIAGAESSEMKDWQSSIFTLPDSIISGTRDRASS